MSCQILYCFGVTRHRRNSRINAVACGFKKELDAHMGFSVTNNLLFFKNPRMDYCLHYKSLRGCLAPAPEGPQEVPRGWRDVIRMSSVGHREAIGTSSRGYLDVIMSSSGAYRSVIGRSSGDHRHPDVIGRSSEAHRGEIERSSVIYREVIRM